MVARPRTSKRRAIPRERPAPSRIEFNRVIRMLREQTGILERLREEQNIQFRRTAQLQVELDTIKQLLEKARNPA